MFKGDFKSVNDIKKNKEILLQKTKDQVVAYSEFMEQSKKSKFRLLMRGILRQIEQAKADYDQGKKNIAFIINGSKDTQFGKKMNREDIYVLEDEGKLKDSILEYFVEAYPLKTKDKSLKEHFINELKERIDLWSKEGGDELKFTFKTAQIIIKLEPISQYVEISGSLGSKIDLSK